MLQTSLGLSIKQGIMNFQTKQVNIICLTTPKNKSPKIFKTQLPQNFPPSPFFLSPLHAMDTQPQNYESEPQNHQTEPQNHQSQLRNHLPQNENPDQMPNPPDPSQSPEIQFVEPPPKKRRCWKKQFSEMIPSASAIFGLRVLRPHSNKFDGICSSSKLRSLKCIARGGGGGRGKGGGWEETKLQRLRGRREVEMMERTLSLISRRKRGQWGSGVSRHFYGVEWRNDVVTCFDH